MGLEEHIKALWYVNVLQYMLSYCCECSVPSVLKYFIFTGSTIYKVNSKCLTPLLYFNLFYLFSNIYFHCGLLNSTMMKLHKCIILMFYDAQQSNKSYYCNAHFYFYKWYYVAHLIYVFLLKCAFRVNRIQIYSNRNTI